MEKQDLELIVRKSTSFRQVAKQLGIDHRAAKKVVEALGVVTTHFDFGRRSMSYIGRTFNRLTIREVFKRSDGRWLCRCSCECGVEQVERRLDGVISGHVPSCGCAYRNRPAMLGANNPSFTGHEGLLGSRLGEIKNSAKRRGLIFSVTKDYLWSLFEAQGRKCALSGVSLKFGRMYYPLETNASLDRIDSTQGYIEGNLQWVHKDVNKIKRDLDQNYFLGWCRRISDHTHTQKQGCPEAAPE